MAVTQAVENGKLVESASESSVKKASKSGLDKDAFLKLLVAQMKYQDPLEPTSNTEFIAQYATFSQVEQMQNMAMTMELSRASGMVGKLVEIQTMDKNGDPHVFQGVVEYVTYENNKAFVSIDGSLYSVDDVHAVIDETYQIAYELAASFVKAIDKLPSLSNLTIADREAVETLQEGYNKMTAYQQGYISDEYVKKLQKYVQRMAELVEIAGGDKDDDGDKTEGTEEGGGDKTEGTEGDEKVDGAQGAGGNTDTEGSEGTEEKGDGEATSGAGETL